VTKHMFGLGKVRGRLKVTPRRDHHLRSAGARARQLSVQITARATRA
jgi:hypothetical protein